MARDLARVNEFGLGRSDNEAKAKGMHEGWQQLTYGLAAPVKLGSSF